MRAMLCDCGRHLQAPDEQGLCVAVCAHLRQDHRATGVCQAEARELVSCHSYRYDYAEVYAGFPEPDEEFGPEPY